MSENRRRRISSGSKQRGNGNDRGDPTGTSRNSHTKNAYQRSTSYDKVRRLVKEEGRNARNLVQWSVPVEDSDDSDNATKTAPRRKLKARTSILKARKSPRDSSTEEKRSSSTEGRGLEKTEKKARKINLRARYWAFLFDNLQRAVDEVYHTCEVDESIVECKEVIMILKSATRDFEALIKRINVQAAFENADKDKKPTSLVWEVRKMSSSPAKHRTPSWPGDARTPPHRQRPTSLAWEVRKTSPGKALGTSPTPENYRTTPSPVNRMLSFNNQNKRGSPVPFLETGASWADRVKGRTTKPVPEETLQPKPQEQSQVDSKAKVNQNAVLEEIHEDDTEGWETVQRGKQGKQNKSRNSSSSTSNSPANLSKQTHSNGTPKVVQEKTPVVIVDEEKKDADVNRESRTDSEKENHPVESSNIPKKEVDIKEQDPAIIEVKTTAEVKTEIEENVKESELVSKLDEAVIAALDEEETLTSELEKYQEEALASAIAEEENLTKELEEEENKEIEAVETDEGDSDLGNTTSSLESSQRTMDWNDLCAEFEEKRSQQGMSWGDMVDIDDNLEARPPGHALLMHEKLSSPSRKKTRAESQKIHEKRQAQAEKKREIMLEEKAQKLRSLHERIAEVQEWKGVLIQQRKKEMDEKLKRAEEKRQVQLQAIVKKARTEDIKANEIAFINSLEAQNKKIDILSRHQGIEARLQDLIDERQRKTEEKQAKEEAAHERRRQLEEERQARLEAMQKQRKIQEEKIYQIRDARDRAREAAAKEKARDRVQRLSALTAAQLAKEEEIQKKIQLKQDESSRRHSEHLEQKREKAVELSMLRHYRTTDLAPQQRPYDKKKVCTLCNMPIPSEVYLLSHLKGRKHALAFNEKHADLNLSEEDLESYSLKYIVQAPSDEPDAKQIAEKERQKGLRKRTRKLRQRMSSRGKEYETNLPSKSQAGGSSECRAKLQKLTKDINKYLQSEGSGKWPQNKISALDRALGEIGRMLVKKDQPNQTVFRSVGGISTLSRVLLLVCLADESKPAPLPAKTLCNATNVLKLAIKGCFENCQYCLYSNKLGPLIDSLMHQLISIIPDDEVSPLNSSGSSDSWKPPSDPVATHIMQVLSSVFLCLSKNGPTSTNGSVSEKRGEAQKKKADTFQQWGQDVISYFVCSGVVDKLTTYFNCIRGTIDDEEKSADFLQHGFALLAAVTKFVTVASKSNDVFASKHEDPTQLINTFQATGLGGIVSLLYGVLLHGGCPSRGDAVIPAELPEHTLSVVNAGIRMLSNIALLDLNILQSALGEEGISLEFRHIATYLIWYCSHYQNYSDLLHEVMLTVGYFTVFHHENQIIVQTGKTPTLLQQLCALPFQYFSDPRLMAILFPSLIACCHNNQENKIILEQEMSCMLLATFIEEMQNIKAKRCRCKNPHNGLGCTHKFSDEYVFKMRYQLRAFTRESKTLFLLGKIATSGVRAGASTNCSKQINKERKRKRTDMGYYIDGIKVCRDAFLFIHITSDKFLTKLTKNYIENGIELHESFAGGSKFNTRRFSTEDIERAITFLSKFAEEKALVIPGRIPGVKCSDPRIRLLPASENKTSVWRKYRKSLNELSAASGTEYRIMGRWSFVKAWKKYRPFILTTKPRSDLCWTCQKHNQKIYLSANASDARKTEIIQAQVEHLRVVELERKLYQEDTAKAKEAIRVSAGELGPHQACSREGVMHYSFDFAQQETLRDKEKAKLLPTAAKAKEKEKERDGSTRMSLESRFPETSWEEAICFFKGSS